MSQCQCVGVDKVKPILISMNGTLFCFWMTSFHNFCQVTLLNSLIYFYLWFFSFGKVMLGNKAILIILMQKNVKLQSDFIFLQNDYFKPILGITNVFIVLAKLKLVLFGDERIVNCVSRFKNDRCSKVVKSNIRTKNVQSSKNIWILHLKIFEYEDTNTFLWTNTECVTLRIAMENLTLGN